jgi:hypothetical protein
MRPSGFQRAKMSAVRAQIRRGVHAWRDQREDGTEDIREEGGEELLFITKNKETRDVEC